MLSSPIACQRLLANPPRAAAASGSLPSSTASIKGAPRLIVGCFALKVIAGDILVGNDDGGGGGAAGLGKKGGGGSDGLLSPECGDRRTVLAVITVLLLAPMVSAT